MSFLVAASLLAMAMSSGGSAPGSQCRTIHLNPAPRIFNSPIWDVSGERLLLVDIAAGAIELYSTSGEREASISKPGPERLDFSTPNTIDSTPSGYVLQDGPSRFILLDRSFKPVGVHDIDADRRAGGRWGAAPFQWVPFDDGLMAYGYLRGEDGGWKTGLFRILWAAPMRVEFLWEMPGHGGEQAYLLNRGYLARVGERTYAFSFEPAYGLIEVNGRGVRLLQGLPTGFGTRPRLPPNQGRASTAALYAAFSRARCVTKLLAAGERLYVLLRDMQQDGHRRWLLAEYDPAKQKTVGVLLLPTSAEHVEVAAGKKWLAIIEKGPFLPDERFTPGAAILVPMTRFGELRGGTTKAPVRVCQP